jgi:hypothetical protein
MSRTSPTFLSRPSSLSLRWSSKLGVIGACIYLGGFALPLPMDICLIVLDIFGATAVVTSSRANAAGWSPLTLAVLAFLAVTAVSTLASEDIGRSVRLSAPLLPGVLLFFLIAEHFTTTRDTRLLYVTLSTLHSLSRQNHFCGRKNSMVPPDPLNVGHLSLSSVVLVLISLPHGQYRTRALARRSDERL